MRSQRSQTDARLENGLPEPQFCSLQVYKGRITCQICFESIQKKHRKGRRKFEKLSSCSNFLSFARKWAETDHKFNNVLKMVDWKFTGEKWAHKICRGKFFKEHLLVSQNQIFEDKKLARVKSVLWPLGLKTNATKMRMSKGEEATGKNIDMNHLGKVMTRRGA